MPTGIFIRKEKEYKCDLCSKIFLCTTSRRDRDGKKRCLDCAK